MCGLVTKKLTGFFMAMFKEIFGGSYPIILFPR